MVAKRSLKLPVLLGTMVGGSVGVASVIGACVVVVVALA